MHSNLRLSKALLLVALGTVSGIAHPVETTRPSLSTTSTESRVDSQPFDRSRIEVFTDRRHLLSKAAGVTVYFVDEEEQLDAELSADLPGDAAQAEAVARQRIIQNKDLIRKRIERFAVGINKSNRYGIERVPAVVFDQKTVVYGLADIDQAIAAFLKAGGKP